MNAEIVTTGTEILLGEIVDTNAAWMARRLRDLGINLFYKTTVGDNLERITAVLRQGLERSDLVLVTGGLGPTVDDVTRDAAALATDRELALDAECLASIEVIFARWGRKLHDNNRRQALLPVGAKPILNPVGTAPGFIVETERKGRPPVLLICLPGVPREMMHLMQETVEPFLAERLGADRVYIRSRTLRTVGIGESMIDSRIADLMARSNPTVGLAAHLGQTDVRITARAASAERADQMLDEVAADLRARLGEFVYGEGDCLAGGGGGRSSAAGGLHPGRGRDQYRRRDRCPSAQRAWWRAGRAFQRSHHGPVRDGRQRARRAGQPGRRRMGRADEAGRRPRKPGRFPGRSRLRCHGSCRRALRRLPRGDLRGAGHGQGRGQSTKLDVGGVDELARRWVGNGALNFLRQWLASRDPGERA